MDHTPAQGLSTKPVRILLVEDNITNQVVAAAIIRRVGHHVDAVADGSEAVKVLSEIPYDIVLMDMQMPVMDGLAATRAIRADDSIAINPRIPIVAMTANAMEADRQACREAGMDDFISKPVTPRALRDLVNKWIRKLAPAHQPTPPEEHAATQAEEAATTPTVETETPPLQPVHEAHAHTEADPAHFNHAELLEFIGGYTDVATEIMQQFLGELPNQIDAVSIALDLQNIPLAIRSAHSLKGAAANIHCPALRALAEKIELALKAGDSATAAQSIPTLRQEGELVQALFKPYLTTPAQPRSP